MSDLRTPIGLFFALVGAILLAVAALQPQARAALTQLNVNLYAGASMLLFGSVMLWLAKRNI